MQRLFIHLLTPATTEADGSWHIPRLRWVCLEPDGSPHSQGQGDLAALAELAPESVQNEPDAIVALIPTEHSLSLQVNVPGRSTTQIRKALPFVVEEYLASDLDAMHIACGPIRAKQPVNCHVLKQDLLADWLAALQQVGLEPAQVLLDADLLPIQGADISLYVADADPDAAEPSLQRVLVRTPAQSLATDRDNLLLTLTALIAQAGAARGLPEELTSVPVPDIQIRTGNGAPTELERAQLAQEGAAALAWAPLQPQGVATEAAPEQDAEPTSASEADLTRPLAFEALLAGWRSGQGINLRQGSFQLERQGSQPWLRWRAVAALAGIWFVVALVANAGQAIWAGHQADRVEREVRELFLSYFPDEQRTAQAATVQRLRIMMSERIGASDGDNRFLVMLAQLADSMQAGESPNLRNVSYSDARTELSVDLSVADFPALERLRDQLAANGLGVDITSAEQQDDRIRARLRIRGA